MINLDDKNYLFLPYWTRVALLFEVNLPRIITFPIVRKGTKKNTYPLDEKIPAWMYLWIKGGSKYVGFPMIITTDLYSASEDWSKTCYCAGKYDSIKCLRNLFLYAQINKLNPKQMILREFIKGRSEFKLESGRPMELEVKVIIKDFVCATVEPYWTIDNAGEENEEACECLRQQMLRINKDDLTYIIRNSQKIAYYAGKDCTINWICGRSKWVCVGFKDGCEARTGNGIEVKDESYSFPSLRYACELEYSGERLATCCCQYMQTKEMVSNQARKKRYLRTSY